MAEVYDFHSRKRLGISKEDFEKNDEVAEEIGRYIGVLPKHETTAIRNMVEIMVQRKEQIDALVKDFHELYEDYAMLLAGLLAFLGVDYETFDYKKTDAYVDENGHTWLVDADERQAFYEKKGESGHL